MNDSGSVLKTVVMVLACFVVPAVGVRLYMTRVVATAVARPVDDKVLKAAQPVYSRYDPKIRPVDFTGRNPPPIRGSFAGQSDATPPARR